MTNSTPWTVKHSMNSSKSGATSIDLPPKELDRRNALGRRPGQPVPDSRPMAFVILERRDLQHSLQRRLGHDGPSLLRFRRSSATGTGPESFLIPMPKLAVAK